MKNILLLSMLLFSIAAQSQSSATRKVIREIVFTGSGYKLGLQHGELLKKEIGEIVAKWKSNTQRMLRKDLDEVIKDFFQYAHFDESIQQWTPDLYQELKGITAASGQSFNDIMLLNLLDEFWVYTDELANHHCSGIGVPATNSNPACIAQNVDIESYTDGYQILMRLTKTTTRPEQFILTHPGLIALAGMNEAGIGACMNSLMQLKASATGLPVAFIVRSILNSTGKDDLLQFIQTVPHASGQNYIIGIGKEVYDFEASCNKVIRFDPKNTNGTIYHTNHPLVNDDVKEWFSFTSPMPNSSIRLDAVEKRVKDVSVINDVLIKETLRSKDDPYNPVCRSSKGGGFTFGSVIMTLSGTPNLQLTAGPPDESEYKQFNFTSSSNK